MESYIWFYVLVMLGMIIVNAIQLKKTQGRDLINWAQIIIYASTVAGYVFCLVGIASFTWFVLITSVAYVLALVFETWQCAISAKRGVWDYLFLGLAFVPVLLSLGLLSGVIS